MGAWPVLGGIGQGISNAGQIFAALSEAARDRALRQQQLNLATTQQQQQAALEGFVDPNQVQPTPAPAQQEAPADTQGALSPVSGLTSGTPGVLAALQGAARSQAGQNPPPPQQIGGAPGPTNAAAQAGQLGGYDPSRYIPAPGGKFLDVTGAPVVQRQLAVMKALQNAEFARAAALKQIPEAINPAQLNLEQQARTEAARHNVAEEGIAQAGENERTAALNNQIAYQGEMLGKGYGTEYQNMIKPIVQRAPAYRAFDQAVAQYDEKNPASTKALLLAAVPLLDPQSRLTARLMQITKYSGDPSLVGQWQQNIMTAAIGKLPQEDVDNLKQAVEARKKNDFDALDEVGNTFKSQHSNIKNIDRQVLPAPALMPGVKAPATAPALSPRDQQRMQTDPAFAAFVKAHAGATP